MAPIITSTEIDRPAPAVYDYATDPTYVEVRFEMPADNGNDSITLEDGIDLRNAPT